MDAAAEVGSIELPGAQPGVQASTVLVALAMLRMGTNDAAGVRDAMRAQDPSFAELEEEDMQLLEAGSSDPDAARNAGRRAVSEARIRPGRELAALVSGIVKVLDSDGVGAAPLASVSVAASLFVGGSKSVKLGFGFTSVAGYTGEELGADRFSDEEEDALEPMVRAHKRASRFVVDRLDLWNVLTAVLVGLLVSTRQARATSCTEVRSLAESTAMSLMTAIGDFSQEKDEGAEGAGEDGPKGLTFLRLGDWYNSGGHVRMSWVELLDPEKWPDVLSEQVGDAGNEDEDEEDDYEDDYGYEEEEGDEVGDMEEGAAGGGAGSAPDDSGFVDEEEEGLGDEDEEEDVGDDGGLDQGAEGAEEALLKAAETEAEQEEYERAAASGAGADSVPDDGVEDGVDDDEDEDDDIGDLPSNGPSALLFSFQTHVRRERSGDADAESDAPVISIRERDRQYLEQIAKLTGIATASPTEVLDAVGLAAASEGQLGPS